MTKEEAIQKAYGEYWKSVRIFVDHSGWLELIKGYFNLEGFSNFINNCDCIDYKYFRPKSLQGIEDNNGWIRIESEEDLPKESGDYFFISKLTNRTVLSYFMDGSKVAYNKTNIVKQYSHYKLIEKPKPPVY